MMSVITCSMMSVLKSLMTPRADGLLKPEARALLVLGVLVSLCASDGVGPRLLPLPAAVDSIATARQIDQREAASRAPSRDQPLRARVEMASAPKGRAGAGRQLTHATANSHGLSLPSPNAARPLCGELYPHVRESSAKASPFRGRAPPRLA